MVRISDLLSEGRENARTATELSRALGCRKRDISLAAQRERLQGSWICASPGRPQGYYLASDMEELDEYIRTLKRREREIHKTRKAMERQMR